MHRLKNRVFRRICGLFERLGLLLADVFLWLLRPLHGSQQIHTYNVISA